ncbi:right-handed parallel beta-helix repeat-containing protein [Anaeromicropila herbilytica]|uniref:Right handed beta helix domain-containing protein n=1 Tax=Anaeromicropila herbilytica TaxID=2785025 RepID=A0A7R7EJZ0_9FIRM|nr:right-handed parallel beta-helix repeat-containing protein [Anaeromicropila herbilytica]BCN30251.1 hypothetical protein bsdtb5_15460 [Anaeromicropila herbilytica]
MDLFGFLKEKKTEENIIIHPFVHTEHTFKYLYCFGIGVLTCGHMKAMTELKEPFSKMLQNIDLSENYGDRIIIDINNNFDYKINDVFRILDTKERQYTFAADLFLLSSTASWSKSYCHNVIEVYMNIFKFSKEERDFFEQFALASKKNQLEQARVIYQIFIQNGYTISYKLLQYMCYNFELKEQLGDIVLEKGESFVIDKPTVMNGNIFVRNGSKLTIDGGELKINGYIFVDGGKLEIHDAKIQVTNCSSNTLIKATNIAMITILGTTIDCNSKCGVILQDAGHLVIRDSKLKNTKLSAGIEFKGKSITLEDSTLEDCVNGGMIVIEEAIMKVSNSTFYNCEADHGGAIFFDSLYDGLINSCVFKNCRAKYIAGAVYFANKKYGQEIINCEFSQYSPENSAIENVYLERDNTFGKEERL